MHDYYKKTIQASLLVALSGILYGFLGYLGTTVIRENMTISTMLFWRFFIAAIWILIFIVGKHARRRSTNFPDRRSLMKMFALGAIGYAGCSGFYFLSSQYLGTGLAMVIFFSYPIIVAVSSWFLHDHKLNASILLTLVVMTTGLFLMRNSASKGMSFLGILFGIINAICYAYYVMGSKKLSSVTMDSNIFTIMVCFGSSFIFLAISLSTHAFSFPVSLKGCGYILALGILATALPIQLMLEGLKYVSSLRASIISVLEPLITVFVGIILLDESISTVQAVGALMILGSTLLVQFNRNL
jgi:drug/metabolite transporter (DMT)-like permease